MRSSARHAAVGGILPDSASDPLECWGCASRLNLDALIACRHLSVDHDDDAACNS